jgi:hypothetical protein
MTPLLVILPLSVFSALFSFRGGPAAHWLSASCSRRLTFFTCYWALWHLSVLVRAGTFRMSGRLSRRHIFRGQRMVINICVRSCL